MQEGARQKVRNLMYMVMLASLRPDGQIETPDTRKVLSGKAIVMGASSRGSPEQ